MRAIGLLSVFALLLALAPSVTYAESQETWRSRISSDGSGVFSEADAEVEVVIGREIAAHVLGKYRLLQNDKLQRYVSLVGGALAQNCSRPDLVFHFAVLDSAEINGYSTPGGYVFVTSAALAAMENEAELAGVLAHEMAHVTERHIVKELNVRGSDKSGVSSLATLIGGATESAGVVFAHSVDLAVEMILKDGYRQEDEMQADADAVVLSAFAGYDPSALVTFLDRVGTVKTAVGKSYPRYDLRLATLQRAIGLNGLAAGQFALNEERFKATNTELPKTPLSQIGKGAMDIGKGAMDIGRGAIDKGKEAIGEILNPR